MARLTKVITVCDGCKAEGDTATFRVGVATGNTRTLDLCPACQGRPFGEIVGAVGGTRGRGRRPATTTPEQLAKIKADRAAAALAATRAERNELLRGKPMFPKADPEAPKAPRKRAARKQAAPEAE